MIDESLIKRHSIGKDGFTWWLGQVCEAKTWEANYPELDVETYDELPGFKRRVKVSILGWHTSSKEELKNDELPWAYCLMPTSAGGGSGGFSESLALTGGEWVFGFFLDGSEGQQPVIIGLFDKSTQEDFRKDIPEIRYAPFSGFTNDKPEPLTVIKTEEGIKRKGKGDANQKVGEGEVKQQQLSAEDNARIDRSDTTEQKAREKVKHLNDVVTGKMRIANNSDSYNPQEWVKIFSERESLLKQVSKDYQDSPITPYLTPLFDEAERTAAGIAGPMKDIQANVLGKAL